MNEPHCINCEMCQDLLPLVQDGVASPSSQQAVEAHLAQCPACRALYSGDVPPASDDSILLGQLKKKLRIFYAFVLFFALFLGVSIVNSAAQFYNALLMPVIGALGYALFRWKALYKVPVFLLIVHVIVGFVRLGLGLEQTGPSGVLFGILWWTALFAVFSILGTVIAGLLHYAFRKENSHASNP